MQHNLGTIDAATWLTRKRLALVFGLALGLLVLIASYGYAWSRDAGRARAVEVHVLQVVEHALELENAAHRMESSQRAFLITGERRYLAGRDQRHAEAIALAKGLMVLVNDRPGQLRRARESFVLVERRYAIMQAGSELAASEGMAAARANFLAFGDPAAMPIVTALQALRNDEARLLDAYRGNLARDTRRFEAVLVYGTALAFAILIASGVGLFRQLTRTARVAQSLRASEEHTRTIINTAYDAFVSVDPAGTIVAWNAQSEVTFGWPRVEAVGRNLSETIVPQQHRRAHEQGMRHFNATGEGPVLNKRIELTAMHRDGHEFPVELTIWPLLVAGQYSFHAFVRDISELRQAEDERDRFFSLSLDMLCIASSDGYFKRLNPAFSSTLGWSIEELTSRPFIEFVHPDDHAATLAEVERQMVDGEPVLQFENRYRHKNGGWRVLSWKSVPQPNGRMYAVARDITDYRESEQEIAKLNRDLVRRHAELEASNRELESFSYSVSHDLRSPLRHIDGFARLLMEDAADALSPSAQEYLHTIVASAKRMGKLIDDLLAFSRLSRQPLVRQCVDMRELVNSAMNEIHANQEPGHDTAQIDVSALPEADGDPALLRQVWSNLLANAVKYSAPRGEQARIVVAGERKGDLIRYWVGDNGVGFDMRYAGKLFGVFQRMHAQDQFEGTGVGLAIVQRIISRHGGQVSATAEVDHGACFSFELPISEAAA